MHAVGQRWPFQAGPFSRSRLCGIGRPPRQLTKAIVARCNRRPTKSSLHYTATAETIQPRPSMH